MAKFKIAKRKQLCTFCGKKWKRVQQHQQFCKARSESSNLIDTKVRKYNHIPMTATATMSLEDRLQEERNKGYAHGCEIGSANSRNEYRKGLEDMKDFVQNLLKWRY